MLYLSTAAKDGFRLGTGGDHPLALQALGPRAASSRWGNFDWPAVLLILVSLFRISVVTSERYAAGSEARQPRQSTAGRLIRRNKDVLVLTFRDAAQLSNSTIVFIVQGRPPAISQL